MDGVSAETRLGRVFHLGVFGGARSDISDFGPDSDRTTYGVTTRFTAGEPNRVRELLLAAVRDDLTLADIGFVQQAELFAEVRSISGRQPLVIDSREFLLNPRSMLEAVFPVLAARWEAGADRAGLHRALAACAEGYPFPADLDARQPVGGLAPPSDAA